VFGMREEGDGAPACRNCHESSNIDQLIAPCKCNGSVKWVHRNCLDTWRSVSPNAESFSRCDVCLQKYLFRIHEESRTWSNVKFALLVFRDLFACILVVNLVIIALGSLVYLADPEAQIGKWIPSFRLAPVDWPNTARAAIVIYEGGGLFFLFLLGIFGSIYSCYLCMNRQTVQQRRQSSLHYNNYPYTSYTGNDCYFVYCNCVDYSHHHTHPCCTCCYANCCCPGGGHGAPAMGHVVGGGAHIGHVGGCGNCNCSGGDCKGDGMHILLILLLIVVVIIILLGLFFGIIACVVGTTRIMNNHIHVLNNRRKVAVFEVLDLATENTSGLQTTNVVVQMEK